jgi:hypothetical protein
MIKQKDNYAVQYFINRSGWGIVFECDPRTQAALLTDFPWLRPIRDGFERGRPLPSRQQLATDSAIRHGKWELFYDRQGRYSGSVIDTSPRR